MPALLDVQNLVKNYRDVQAVQDISFSVEQGTCFGLLGPNGAGKTTTIEIIEDVIQPTSGTILFRGSERTGRFHDEVGIQFQQTSLLNYLTVRETLITFQRMYKKSASIEELAELCSLNDFLHQMNDKISGGQKQRFLLALALVNQPDLLFLDEPSTGLDPQSRRNLWDIVSKIKKDGKTIILTTHYMEEAEYLCDKIAIMDHGKIIAHGSPSELIKEFGGDVSVSLPQSSFKSLTNADTYQMEIKEGRVEVLTDNPNLILEELLSKKIDLTDILIQSPNLETVFLNLTGRKLRE